MSTIYNPDFLRKVRERYGDAPFTVLYEFSVPDTLEGGGNVATTIRFTNSNKVTVYLATQNGLWYEGDAPTLETLFAKAILERSEAFEETVALLNLQKHGAALAPPDNTIPEAALALLSAEKHVAYLADPTPPDITPDTIDEGSRNADYSVG